jgi:GH15 family glucan-1,4-alpha-glucosidase
MTSRIEDYALIGDCHTAALVARDGSIDWLCLPRFDSAACFAALLGEPKHGRWQIAPASDVRAVRRRYRGDTLILETEFSTEQGTVALIDFMPQRGDRPGVIRIVEGRRGRVPMRCELIIRFDYGSIVPWVTRLNDGGITAIAGPDRLRLRTNVPLRGENFTTVADFEVAAGQHVPFVLTWGPSHKPFWPDLDPEQALRAVEAFWNEWSGRCTYQGEWRDTVMRSLITLKALTYAPTGGIVAAPTTSLPEQIGGVRNWDYRYCWLRDATFTIYALTIGGYLDEAHAWRDWLLRAVAGDPSQIQILYGLAGERRLTEWRVPWLPGYENSSPVRVGNAAHSQFQLDVYGEMADTTYQCIRLGLKLHERGLEVRSTVLKYLESAWKQPDEGIWEVRGPRRHFTHSKVMAWVAFDRAIKEVENLNMPGPIDRWRAVRQTIHDQVCREGFNEKRGSFVQSYGSDELDASLLMIPMVGFLPPDDPRVVGTVAAIERELMRDGFVERYRSESNIDGLPPGEGVFLPCTFWLADNLALQGRLDAARALFERLLSLCNDVGLISEEYDPKAGRLVGNFPQAFTHISLINTARNLSERGGPAEHRRGS